MDIWVQILYDDAEPKDVISDIKKETTAQKIGNYKIFKMYSKNCNIVKHHYN